ncbi:potassium channel family protein [Psychromonas sp. 14N.309.X.WAT.B.A12]|uniref:potassium channel family protein n=1 Tax=Psychromonas sp. 14N.309.X.WAT.B.A12 TaxID=2998322 RepID=UPI0025B209D9|nr:potassium channel family protein [Psychromonas sp. 14N.309.X.WAT.B.A12]MDN2664947.1 potassium channel family protein [Psychromonas sp. 14N.309.X.WAT.B.A12]
MNIFNYSPKAVGIIYSLLIPIFGLIYWSFPSFWECPLSLVESMYFSVVTITTLGYGEITPATDIARVLTALEALSGIFLIGLFLNSLAHRYSEKETEKAKIREDEQWRPARILVARHICRVHQMLFNSCRFVFDPDYHIDTKSHGFPANITQRQADSLAKEQQIKHLDYHYNDLKKMIEYNNVALDSSLQPRVITYIVLAKELLSTCKFVVDAYKDTNGSQFHSSYNDQDVHDMENIFQEMLALFPEIIELEKPIGPAPITADSMLKLVTSSNKKCQFIKLRIVD